MKIAVTGGTGFIGTYVVKKLLQEGCEVIVTGTNESLAKRKKWFNQVEFVRLDLNNIDDAIFQKLAEANKLVHLAWTGLPNYKELFHFEQNLMPQYFFLQRLIKEGVKDITITGTCFEYGMRNGALSTDLISDPQNPYALAKDTLRKFLQHLQTTETFRLKWIRLFYMYGKGQSKKSILSQLDEALERGDEIFNMSGGEQLRDYLPIEEVANYIVCHSLYNNESGLFNCCSGTPVSIRNLVENHLKARKKTIKLNLGYYQYTDYEPMSFWGQKG